MTIFLTLRDSQTLFLFDNDKINKFLLWNYIPMIESWFQFQSKTIICKYKNDQEIHIIAPKNVSVWPYLWYFRPVSPYSSPFRWKVPFFGATRKQTLSLRCSLSPSRLSYRSQLSCLVCGLSWPLSYPGNAFGWSSEWTRQSSYPRSKSPRRELRTYFCGSGLGQSRSTVFGPWKVLRGWLRGQFQVDRGAK